METGIVAETLDDYHKAIEYLYNNKDELKRMSKNAINYAKEQYDIKKTISKWNELFNKIMSNEKKARSWDREDKIYMKPSELYIESLGDYNTPLKEFINSATNNEKKIALKNIKRLFDTNIMFYSKNKGSVLQYLKYFPDDKYLQEWSKLCK